MSVLAIVLIVLILFGGGAAYPRGGMYNAGWGYGPFGGIVGLLVLLLLLHLLGVF